jgi:hypothetical protein
MKLTSQNISGRVLCSVYIGRNSSAEISDPNLQSHPHTALILAREIVS